MKVILGIDIGISTIKFITVKKNGNILSRFQAVTPNEIVEIYSLIDAFLARQNLSSANLCEIILTGVGASLFDEKIYNLPTYKVNEFEAIGRGGLALSGLDSALVISMGTGTAFVHANSNKTYHIGGSGVGGGTLMGLSKLLLNVDTIEGIVSLANNGNIHNVDLSIGDISNVSIKTLPPHITASNFGKIKSGISDSDIALGLINTIFQTIGTLAAFAYHNLKESHIVIVGSMSNIPQAQPILTEVGNLYNVKFIIPKDATFATVIGATSISHS